MGRCVETESRLVLAWGWSRGNIAGRRMVSKDVRIPKSTDIVNMLHSKRELRLLISSP